MPAKAQGDALSVAKQGRLFKLKSGGDFCFGGTSAMGRVGGMGLTVVTATGAAAYQRNQLFKLRLNVAGLQYGRTQSTKGTQ